ncbi:amidohydrolase family protein [Actinokineospora xionganensis]|uniref:Amidohydrolase family protein n=1 Tax=Actinokineospora xionganensis TaxID=2684470 RepID=A0ABN2CED3_9PSEU|nr:amidohydrolase family protein [Actinokineospora xionganensis]MBC6445983.1 amidohydrolase family protein [Actinokineospora xionganensis]
MPELTDTTLIRAGSVYTADKDETLHRPGSVLVAGGRIAAVGAPSDVDAVVSALPEHVRGSMRTLDAADMMVLPGFVNAHWHDMFAARLPFRGALRDPSDVSDEPGFMAAGGDVRKVSLGFDSFSAMIDGLSADEAGAIARYSVWTQLRAGSTTLGDTGSLNRPEALVAAAEELGVRLSVSTWAADAVCAPGETRARRTQDTDTVLAGIEDLLRRFRGRGDGRIRVRPSALYTPNMSDELGAGLAALVSRYDTDFVTHVAALRNESDIVTEYFGTSPVRRLADLGLLSERTMAVHCAFVDAEERELLLDAGVHISHSPAKYGATGESTMTETRAIPELAAAGLPVSLSTDASVYPIGGMAEAMRAAWQTHNEMYADQTRVLPSTALAMATRVAAQGLGWADEVGSVSVGMRADLVLVPTGDWRYLLNPRPLEAYLTLGGSADVDTVMVGGRVLLYGGRSTEVDERELETDYLHALRSFSSRHLRIPAEVIDRVIAVRAGAAEPISR